MAAARHQLLRQLQLLLWLCLRDRYVQAVPLEVPSLLTLGASLIKQCRHGVKQRINSKRGVPFLLAQVVRGSQCFLLVRCIALLPVAVALLLLRLGCGSCCILDVLVTIILTAVITGVV